MTQKNLKPSWNPLDAKKKLSQDKFCSPEDFSSLANGCAAQFDADIFRALCRTAIKLGIISEQDFETRFNKGTIPNNPEKDLSDWKIPSPDLVRNILKCFSAIDTENISGSKLPWRHEQSVQPAAERVFPDQQHKAVAHPPRGLV